MNPRRTLRCSVCEGPRVVEASGSELSSMFSVLDISVVDQLLAGVVALWETDSWFISATALGNRQQCFCLAAL